MRLLVVGATLSADHADALARQLGPGAVTLPERLSIPCLFVFDPAVGDRDPALECIPRRGGGFPYDARSLRFPPDRSGGT